MKSPEWFELLRVGVQNPWVEKLFSIFLAVLLLLTLLSLAKRKLVNRISDSSKRHRARKTVNFIGFLLFLLVAGSVFSDSLGKLTVVFGVAGAGIAFALQEVIASVAGWFAITFGGFFRTGDRVQLGGHPGGRDRHRSVANDPHGVRGLGEWRPL